MASMFDVVFDKIDAALDWCVRDIGEIFNFVFD